jgi:tetratricopeptide (TPR) repeat protein
VREGNPTAIALLLFALVVGTFLPALHHGFVSFDDNVYVYENARIQVGLSWDNLRWALTTLDAGFWHPLTWLSLLLDGQLFGLRPGGYHLTSLLLHAASTVLLFVLFRLMTGATWRSAFVAALFALHPLHVEPVAWVAGRKDVLSTLFWLLALLMYVRYAGVRRQEARGRREKAETRNPHHASRYYLLALFFFVCGLMSKTMVVTLPVILLLLDWWPLQRFQLNAQPSTLNALRPLFLEKVPFLAAALVCGLLTLRAENSVGALSTDAALTVSERLANAALSYVRYLVQTVWPSGFAVYYPYPAAFSLGPVVGAGLSLLTVSAVLLRAASRRPGLAFGWIWYVVTLLPVIGLIQVGSHSHADRYAYVPLIGIFTLLVWGAEDLTRRWRYQAVIASAAAVLVISLCAALSRHQLGYWRDSETLLRHAIAVTRDNEPMHNNLGTVLVGQGRLDEAIGQFREAIRLNPESAGVHDNLGATLARQGKLDEALLPLREAIRLDPACADAHNNLGAVLGRQGRLDEAIDHLQLAIKLTPGDAGAHCNLGDALASTGRLDEAIGQYQEALRLKPDDPETRVNLGVALGRKGRLDEAIVLFQQAVQANPKLVNAHNDLASALLRQGRAGEALPHYQAVIEAQPANPYYLNNLAWVLATCPQAAVRNGARAVELAQQAEQLSGGKNASILGTLAAAYAETGRFPEAVATAQRALELAAAQTNTAQVEPLREQIELYRSGSAFRDTSLMKVTPSPR